MATAWNKAMIHIDDEVVFDKLNAMMSAAKAAADSHPSCVESRRKSI